MKVVLSLTTFKSLLFFHSATQNQTATDSKCSKIRFVAWLVASYKWQWKLESSRSRCWKLNKFKILFNFLVCASEKNLKIYQNQFSWRSYEEFADQIHQCHAKYVVADPVPQIFICPNARDQINVALRKFQRFTSCWQIEKIPKRSPNKHKLVVAQKNGSPKVLIILYKIFWLLSRVISAHWMKSSRSLCKWATLNLQLLRRSSS